MRKLASRVIMLILTVSALITSASASYEYDKSTGHATISGSINTVTEKAYSYWYYVIEHTQTVLLNRLHNCNMWGGAETGKEVIEEILTVLDGNSQTVTGNPAWVASNSTDGIYYTEGDKRSRSYRSEDIQYFQIENYILDQGLNISQRAIRPYHYTDWTPIYNNDQSTWGTYRYWISTKCSSCNRSVGNLDGAFVYTERWKAEATQRSTDEVYLQPTTSPKSFTLKNVSTRNLSIKTDVPVTIDGGTYSGSPAA